MKTISPFPRASASASNINALVEEVTESFKKFCLTTGIAYLRQMMSEDADRLAGKRYSCSPDKPGHSWGHTRSQIGFHGGKVDIDRPRLRCKPAGKEMSLPGR